MSNEILNCGQNLKTIPTCYLNFITEIYLLFAYNSMINPVERKFRTNLNKIRHDLFKK